tara:strand:- start:10 stop:771 length:762 start_codon:yes stop_codon:yes gene_type:complete
MTTMARLLRGLCSDESMPQCIEFYHNGTSTVLMKTESEEGETIYVGTPTYKWQGKNRTLPYSLVVSPSQDRNSLVLIDGRAALNCIAQGGWSPEKKRPSEQDRMKVRDALTTVIVFYCADIAKEGVSKKDDTIIEAIKRETGYEVLKDNPTDDDLENMAAMGVKAHIVDYLVRNKWKLNITTESLLQRIRNYGEVVKGEWTSEASNIATTSGTPFSVVSILRRRGYTIRKKARKKVQGNPNRSKSKNDLGSYG